jgi:hypothetical protein
MPSYVYPREAGKRGTGSSGETESLLTLRMFRLYAVLLENEQCGARCR